MVKNAPLKSICFFSSYYITPDFPNYIKFYLSELKRHFSEVVFLTNEKNISPNDIQFLSSNDIPYKLYKNEGFDFGMWYKAFLEYDITKYDRIGLVNDSCILFNKLDFYFDWLDEQAIDYSGFTDCNLIKYHIQSYFIVINQRAIPHIMKYFEANGIISDFTQLIKTYEVGLCSYLINAGMNLAAYYSFKAMPGIGNPSWMYAKSLIKEGYPLIKKKIIIRYYGIADWRSLIANGFDPYPSHYIKLIKKIVPDIDSLLTGLPIQKTFKEEVKFLMIARASQIYGALKKIKHLIKIIILGNEKKGYMTVGGLVQRKELKDQ